MTIQSSKKGLIRKSEDKNDNSIDWLRTKVTIVDWLDWIGENCSIKLAVQRVIWEVDWFWVILIFSIGSEGNLYGLTNSCIGLIDSLGNWQFLGRSSINWQKGQNRLFSLRWKHSFGVRLKITYKGVHFNQFWGQFLAIHIFCLVFWLKIEKLQNQSKSIKNQSTFRPRKLTFYQFSPIKFNQSTIDDFVNSWTRFWSKLIDKLSILNYKTTIQLINQFIVTF